VETTVYLRRGVFPKRKIFSFLSSSGRPPATPSGPGRLFDSNAERPDGFVAKTSDRPANGKTYTERRPSGLENGNVTAAGRPTGFATATVIFQSTAVRGRVSYSHPSNVNVDNSTTATGSRVHFPFRNSATDVRVREGTIAPTTAAAAGE